MSKYTSDKKCQHCKARQVSRPYGLCKVCHLDKPTRRKHTPVCKACRKVHVTRPRGLCWVCYRTPGVKAAFPASRLNAASAVATTAPTKGPRKPCHAPPGSFERLTTLIARAAAGVELRHPDDSKDPHGTDPGNGTRRSETTFRVHAKGDDRYGDAF